jgi:hypothetical protein
VGFISISLKKLREGIFFLLLTFKNRQGSEIITAGSLGGGGNVTVRCFRLEEENINDIYIYVYE